MLEPYFPFLKNIYHLIKKFTYYLNQILYRIVKEKHHLREPTNLTLTFLV